MLVKIHEDKRADGREVVAICDKELIGQTLEEGNLSLTITERFYKGEEKSKEEIKKLLKTANNLNLVGKKTIKLAINSGIVSKENIIKIKGVPHAQIYS